MNQTIQSMNNHRSIRKFLSKPIDEGTVNQIIEATRSMPTSQNGQQVSVVVVRDQDTKNKISVLSGNQPWIKVAPVFLVFVIDFYKSGLATLKHNEEQHIQEGVDGLAIGILDSGIALGGAIVAAESLGLGTVAIGGIRQGARKVIDLLKLPKYTFPINGLCIGHMADESIKKPRLDIETFRHEEIYHIDGLDKHIDNYDLVMKDYLATVGRANEVDWSTYTTNNYKNYSNHLKSVLLEQGFELK